jgi:hypothetical protein
MVRAPIHVGGDGDDHVAIGVAATGGLTHLRFGAPGELRGRSGEAHESWCEAREFQCRSNSSPTTDSIRSITYSPIAIARPTSTTGCSSSTNTASASHASDEESRCGPGGSGDAVGCDEVGGGMGEITTSTVRRERRRGRRCRINTSGFVIIGGTVFTAHPDRDHVPGNDDIGDDAVAAGRIRTTHLKRCADGADRDDESWDRSDHGRIGSSILCWDHEHYHGHPKSIPRRTFGRARHSTQAERSEYKASSPLSPTRLAAAALPACGSSMPLSFC